LVEIPDCVLELPCVLVGEAAGHEKRRLVRPQPEGLVVVRDRPAVLFGGRVGEAAGYEGSR
jgi:hypothetical protein